MWHTCNKRCESSAGKLGNELESYIKMPQGFQEFQLLYLEWFTVENTGERLLFQTRMIPQHCIPWLISTATTWIIGLLSWLLDVVHVLTIVVVCLWELDDVVLGSKLELHTLCGKVLLSSSPETFWWGPNLEWNRIRLAKLIWVEAVLEIKLDTFLTRFLGSEHSSSSSQISFSSWILVSTAVQVVSLRVRLQNEGLKI